MCLQDGAGEDGKVLLRGAAARGDVFGATQCAFFTGGEYESVNDEADFWWECEEAEWRSGFHWCSIRVVDEAFATWSTLCDLRGSRHENGEEQYGRLFAVRTGFVSSYQVSCKCWRARPTFDLMLTARQAWS